MGETRGIPDRRPSLALAAAVCAVLVALMVVLRLWIYPSRFVPLGYGVPLLAYLWHRHRGLHWGTAAAFGLLVLFKAALTLRDGELASELELSGCSPFSS